MEELTMKPCPKCGADTREVVGDHRYLESGLDNVTLSNVRRTECTACDFVRVWIPAISELHRVLAEALATVPVRLGPKELRFLRTHLGHSRDDYARINKLDPVMVRAWESGEAHISLGDELRLRLAVLLQQPVTEYHDALVPPDSLAPERPLPRVRISREHDHWARPAVDAMAAMA